jgi:hypothetical protein
VDPELVFPKAFPDAHRLVRPDGNEHLHDLGRRRERILLRCGGTGKSDEKQERRE